MIFLLKLATKNQSIFFHLQHHNWGPKNDFWGLNLLYMKIYPKRFLNSFFVRIWRNGRPVQSVNFRLNWWLMKRPTRSCCDVEVGVEESLGDSMLTAGNRLELSGHSLEFLYVKVSIQNWKLMFDLTHSHIHIYLRAIQVLQYPIFP